MARAIRLTSHPGIEVFGKFSPDGKWIAFTGQYDGDEQVYVVSVHGRRAAPANFLSGQGPFDAALGLGQSGLRLEHATASASSSSRSAIRGRCRSRGFTRFQSKAAPAEALPMPTAGSGDYSPDGTQMVYSPQSRDFRPEKRYGGGQANALYIFDLKTYAAKRITEGPRATRDPMWVGDTIYFNSDRDGHFNLYAYNTGNGKTTQVTNNKTLGRALAQFRQSKAASFMSSTASCRCSTRAAARAAPISITVPDEGLARRPSRIPAAGNHGISRA